MAKKLGIGLAMVLILSITGIVMAQDTPPLEDGCPFNGTCSYDDGFGGMMHGGARGGMWGYGGTVPELLAEALGMSEEDLTAALAEGKTVTELAEAQGIELADVVAVLIAPRVERLDQAVEDGTMTREQADWMIEEMEEHMLQMLEWGMGVGGGRGSYGSGCPMHSGISGSTGGFRGGMHGYRQSGGSMLQRWMPRWSVPQS